MRSLVVRAALLRCLRLDSVRRPQLDQAILCCPERRVARLYLPCVALRKLPFAALAGCADYILTAARSPSLGVTAQLFIAGGVAGVANSIISGPVEHVRIRASSFILAPVQVLIPT